MDSIPNDLLELKARFDQWRANRKTRSEPIPDELRSEALEMTKRFSSSLLLKVLKVQVWHLKNRSGTKRSARAAAPKSSTIEANSIRTGNLSTNGTRRGKPI